AARRRAGAADRGGKMKRRVLIVDDEADLLALLALRFAPNPTIEAATAPGGAEALAKLEAFRPQLIVADIVMPGMDGWELRSRLAAMPAWKDVPVILMT